jgi:DNA repair protein RecN (Recombination protein N)
VFGSLEHELRHRPESEWLEREPIKTADAADGSAPYHGRVLRSLRISNLVLIREAELELGPGLNAITGETGAGKTILTNAIGLLLGARGDAALIGAAGDEAYVEAEFDAADDETLGALAELRPDDEDGVVLARRIFADGRTRAYAWGRSAAREDVAAAAEALIAMSGQFEQRRLARPAYQRAVLDTFAGLDTRGAARAWRELQAARRTHDELTRDAAAAEARIEQLRALAADTEGHELAREDELRAERERLRHVSELVEGAAAAAAALSPDDGTGASDLVGAAERAVAPLERLAPELQAAGDALRQAELQLRETASDLHAFLSSLEAEPGRLELVEGELEELADLKRRYRVQTYAELLERGEEARRELAALDEGQDPVEAARRALDDAEAEVDRLHAELRAARRAAATPFAEAVAVELRGIGLGDGEFQAVVTDRDPGSTGADDVGFLIRPNAGLPFGPVAETASGGELSRVALAIAAVAGGETMVFDEIDAGIGGTTAHAVAETLRRLAVRAQIVTITHLPQIATVADRHFLVEKVPGDPTHTRIEPLDDAQRRDEVERMLGGADFLASLDR